jgi:inner membrane protease subunit 1
MKRLFNITHETYLNFRFLVWYLFFHAYVFDFHMLEGESMYPTFQPFGEIVLVDKITPRLFKKNFKKDDVICLINPVNNEINLCKRVLFLEGEKLALSNGNEVEIPDNHLWVEGDNKQNSLDSRRFGPVSKHMVLGKVWLQIWPKFKLL